jgi:ribose transport system ATP-binding protein
MAKEGAVVLLSSVEYEDLAHLCDRVHVVRDGLITRTLERGELSAHAVAAAVYDADVVA